ncbi:MAG: recombinase family protein [Candidatus Acidiferrales bacterium]|jgi:DNA invertase Pin-like site-specific DNA recombinase
MAIEKLSPEAISSKAKSKRAVIYARVSTIDQHPETQLYDLREMAKRRGYDVVCEYSDRISGAKQKRPGLDQLMADARRHKFDAVLVRAFDRMARSVRHVLEILDELNHLGIELLASERISTPEVRSVGRWS